MRKSNKPPVVVTTKTGVEINTCYCRKCMSNLPVSEFFDAVDSGIIDANGKMSVCKNCINDLYEQFFKEFNSMEKAIQKLCSSLNVRYSNEAVEALKANMNTLVEGGKNVNNIFGIYKSRLVSVIKGMDKSVQEDMTYQDVGTIFVEKQSSLVQSLSRDVIDFWGSGLSKEDIAFLQKEYVEFSKSNPPTKHPEVVLLREVCYQILDIKNKRANNDDTSKEIKSLQELMTSLSISPKAMNANTGGSTDSDECLGMWIRDIEKYEPCQWLKTDPRGDMYRDVADVDKYYERYIERPVSTAVRGSKDFNLSDDEDSLEDLTEEDVTSSFTTAENDEEDDNDDADDTSTNVPDSE